MSKIAWTKNGNAKVTMNTVQLQAVRDVLGHVNLGIENEITEEVIDLLDTLDAADFSDNFVFDPQYTLRCKRNKAEDTFELFFD